MYRGGAEIKIFEGVVSERCFGDRNRFACFHVRYQSLGK
jgi:hypothetical protein